jgi:acetyl-CoA acetyltransferase
MPGVVIVSTARTALTKSARGAFNNTHGITLAGHALENAIKRAGVSPEDIEDVIMGCAYPEGAHRAPQDPPSIATARLACSLLPWRLAAF